MANIKIIVDGALMDGHKVSFKAPCDCVTVEKLKVCYLENGEQKTRLFTMRDSHNNDLTGLGNLFSEGAIVYAVLDTVKGYAYLQNASTNKYLEQKITPVDNLESDRADLPLSAKQGKKLNESLGNRTEFPDGTVFYPDSQDGKYGFNTDPNRGADTFHPFKSGFELLKYTRPSTASDSYTFTKAYDEAYFLYAIGDSQSLATIESLISINNCTKELISNDGYHVLYKLTDITTNTTVAKNKTGSSVTYFCLFA